MAIWGNQNGTCCINVSPIHHAAASGSITGKKSAPVDARAPVQLQHARERTNMFTNGSKSLVLFEVLLNLLIKAALSLKLQLIKITYLSLPLTAIIVWKVIVCLKHTKYIWTIVFWQPWLEESSRLRSAVDNLWKLIDAFMWPYR